MDMSRRNMLLAAAALPVAGQAAKAAAPAAPAPAATPPAPAPAPIALPDRVSFPQSATLFMDCGTSHPISRASRAAVDAYTARRAGDTSVPQPPREKEDARHKFARLINAEPDEIGFVQSTTTGEQLVIKALGLPAQGAHIVTDTMHFFGSFPMYEELAKQGCDVTWVRERDGRISMEDMDKAIRPGTKLVALSLVSTFNGFEHDLKAVCDLAHARGAVVYADIIHAAGCVPIDVKASGVDFAACASYKWLMGDFGLGFVFARKDRQAQLKRTQYGYEGIGTFQSHVYPLDPPATSPANAIADYAFEDSAMGHFAYGTYTHTVEAMLSKSLDYLLDVGVGRIQAHVQPLVVRMKQELPKLGYQVYSPMECRTPFVTCIAEDARGKIGPKLAAANIRIMTTKNRFRITPSVFNDMADVDRLLKALA